MGVNGYIDILNSESILNFFGEKSFAFYFIQALMLNDIPLSFDDLNYARHTQPALHVMRLPQGKVRATTANNKGTLAHEQRLRLGFMSSGNGGGNSTTYPKFTAHFHKTWGGNGHQIVQNTIGHRFVKMAFVAE